MILVSGEALVDLIPEPGKDNAYNAVLGGSPFNVARGLGRLGAPTGFISNLSRDANGEALAAALASDGVSLDFVERNERPTPLAFVMRGTEQTGSRYSFYLDATAFDGAWPFPKSWPAAAEHLHVGSISAVEQRHSQPLVEVLKMARPVASISFDPNIRPMVTPDRAAVLQVVEREAALATFVKASDEDLAWLYPGRAPQASLAAWNKMGPRFCVLTRGGEGVMAIMGDQVIEQAAIKIDVVDTVGAGDSFMSALLAAMNKDGGLGAAAKAPQPQQLASWLKFAATASAITCSRRGSDPPTWAEVQRRL